MNIIIIYEKKNNVAYEGQTYLQSQYFSKVLLSISNGAYRRKYNLLLNKIHIICCCCCIIKQIKQMMSMCDFGLAYITPLFLKMMIFSQTMCK